MARDCSENIILRVTPEEKRLLVEEASKVGLSMSGFLLFEALGEKLGDSILESRRRGRRPSSRE